MRIGGFEGFDLLGGKIGWEAILPELMLPFDFAFGLRGGRVAESDAIKSERLSQSSERIGRAAKKQAVIIDIKQERQAVGTEGLRQEIEVGQEVFLLVELGAGEEPAAIIEHIEHGPKPAGTRKIPVRRGVQLPQLANPTALPAANGGDGLLRTSGLGESVLDGPAAHLSTIQFEVAQTQDLAGDETVGGGWPGAQTGPQ